MLNLLFAYAVLLFLFTAGFLLFKVISVNEDFINDKILFLAPIVGFIGIVNTLEILNLFIAVKYAAIGICTLMAIGGVYFRRQLICAYKAILSARFFWVILIIISIVYAVPFLGKIELFSLQYFNNDIVYYLSDMEWLKNNPSLKKVSYDTNHMFYWCAEYMLTQTRIGFDLFGAFVMSATHLEAHQIFSALGLLGVLIIQFVVFYIENAVLKVRGKVRYFILLIIGICPAWSELLELQYIPQLYGIVLLMGCIACMITFFSSTNRLPKKLLLGIFISGTLAVYAEFASYVFICYMIFLVGSVIYTKHLKGILIQSLKLAALSICMNPAGFYRCLKLNSFVLYNSGANQANIDPYMGNLMSLPNVISKLLGFPLHSSFEGVEHIFGTICIIGMVLSIFIIIFHYFCNMHNEYKYVLTAILCFFLLYEIYFRISRYAYGEYKHLLSIAPTFFMIVCFMGYQSAHVKSGRIYQSICLCSSIVLLIASGYRIIDQYYLADYYYYDHTLMEVRDACKSVPENEAVGISGSAADIHGALYALRDRNTVILANNISYFPFSDTPFTRYRIYENNIENMDYAEILWKNNRFTLIKNTGLQSAFYTGFHTYDDKKNSIWTCDHESVICVTNFSDEEKIVALSFGTDTVDKKEKEIRVILDGQIIADEKSGSQIVTDAFTICPNEIKQIHIYTSEPLDIYNFLNVGFYMINYALVQYEFG